LFIVSAIDYTLIITSCISAVSAIVAAAVGAWVAKQVKTPSGDTLGKVAERTHDLAAVNATAVAMLNGGKHEAERDTDKDAA